MVEAEDGQSILKLASEAAVTRGPVNGEEGVRAGTWRVGYSPTLTTDFGFSGYIGRYTPDFLEVDERITAIGVDGLWKRGAFALEGEYIHTGFGDTDRVVNAFVDTVTGSTGIPPLAGAAGNGDRVRNQESHADALRLLAGRPLPFLARALEGHVPRQGLRRPAASARSFATSASPCTTPFEEVAIEHGEIERGDAADASPGTHDVRLAYRPCSRSSSAWPSSSIGGWKAPCSCSPAGSPNEGTGRFSPP